MALNLKEAAARLPIQPEHPGHEATAIYEDEHNRFLVGLRPLDRQGPGYHFMVNKFDIPRGFRTPSFVALFSMDIATDEHGNVMGPTGPDFSCLFCDHPYSKAKYFVVYYSQDPENAGVARASEISLCEIEGNHQRGIGRFIPEDTDFVAMLQLSAAPAAIHWMATLERYLSGGDLTAEAIAPMPVVSA